MRLLRCPTCHLEWLAPASFCAACWGEVLLPVPQSKDGTPYGQDGARPHTRRGKPTQPLAEALRTHQAPALVLWAYFGLLLPLIVAMVISGKPGSGKSTAATVMALRLALLGYRVLWISPEEGRSDTTLRRFALAHRWLGSPPLPAGSPLISDGRSLHEVDAEIRAFEVSGGQVVFIDSLTTLGASDQWWEDLTNGPLGVVGIAHQNSRGTPFGGHRVAHDPDVHLSVADFTLRVEKSRWFQEDAPRSWRVDEPESLEREEGEVVPFPGGRG